MMRKFLIVLLAVLLMLPTLAALPVAAAGELADYEISKTDGTTVNDAKALDLVVTEYMSNTTSSMGDGSADAFQYVEVYNRGTTDVNLYDLAVVRGANSTSGGAWRKQHMFEAKLSINPGNIYTNTNATNQSNACVNPNSAVVRPGEFAIIWFWTDTTNSVSNTFGKSLGAVQTDNKTGKTVFHHYFRQHYRTQNPAAADAITDDLLVVAVYAGSTNDSTNKPTFSLNKSGSYMYALVKDEAGANNFDYKTEKAFESFYNKTDKIFSAYNDKIVCLWQWGTNTALSIPAHTDYFEGRSSVYVPADCTPDLRNATRQAVWEEAYEEKHNYYELGFVDGFKEVGLVAFEEMPTIGSMDAWQWAYVDPNPDRVPDAVKALAADGKTWQEVAISAYVQERSAERRGGEPVAREEIVNDPVFVDRDELQRPQTVWVYYRDGKNFYKYSDNGHMIEKKTKITFTEYQRAYEELTKQSTVPALNAAAPAETPATSSVADTQAPAKTVQVAIRGEILVLLCALLACTLGCVFIRKRQH